MSALIKDMGEMSGSGREKLRTDERGIEATGPGEPLLLTVPQAARMLAIGRSLLYELIASGELEAIHIGRCARVPLDALSAFVERQRARA
jgi:excisionase family DNA binding protein